MLARISMNPFPLSSRGAQIFDEIRHERPRLGLTAGKPTRAGDQIARLTDVEILGGPVKDSKLARASRAGLLLWADCFDESHAVSQALVTPEGSYWHGILHRREPDPTNAKYWFRQVGDHSLWETLAVLPPGHPAQGSRALADVTRSGRWDAARFVDACASLELLKSSQRQGGETFDSYRHQLEDLEEWEAFALLRHCIAGALGKPPGSEGGA